MPNTPPPPASGAASILPETMLPHLFHVFLDNVPDYVYFKDLESRFIAVSTNLAVKHGFGSAEQMVGKTDRDFFAEHEAARFRADECAIIETGQPLINTLEKEVWKDGSITWSLTTKLPLRDENGAIIGTFGVNRDITASRRLQEQLEATHRDLLEASRRAGMADVATGVLHNVGNVLNSLNVTAEVLAEGLRTSRIDGVSRLASLLASHAADLPAFFGTAKGAQVPGYLSQLAAHLVTERDRHLDQIAEMRKCVDHIKDIVAMQQSACRSSGLVEAHDPAALVEDALRLNAIALARHGVHIIRDFAPVPFVLADRTRVLQILINLLRNAKHALDDGAPAEKRLLIRIEAGDPGQVRISVNDNGVGIPPENLERIFSHGFTTRKEGHGFGLHSAANAAAEIGGTLSAASDGPGHGATFALVLPQAPPDAAENPYSKDTTRALLLDSLAKS